MRPRESMRVIVDGFEYNLDSFKHPGGDKIIQNLRGKDASDIFKAFHAPVGSSARAYAILKRLPRRKLTRESTQSALQRDFAELRQEIYSDPSWLTTPWWMTCSRLAWLLSLLFFSVCCTMHAHDAASVMWSAAAAAFFWQQSAFLGHDLGHSSVFQNARWDHWLGVVFGNVLTCISISWWKDTHSTHHVYTNSVEDDCDIQHEVLAIHHRFVDSAVFSTYHQRFLWSDQCTRLILSFQHYLFYPLMFLARYNLYLQSVLFLAKQPCKTGLLELGALAVHFVIVGCVVAYIPSCSLRWLWVVTANGLAGILHVQITLSHFPMPVHDTPPEEYCFIRHQVETSMDISSNKYTDFLHGGLQYQATHHLFPRVPRHCLRPLKERVLVLCQKHKLKYRTETFYQANCMLISTLTKTAMHARRNKERAQGSFILLESLFFCRG